VYGKSKIAEREKARQMENKVKSMLTISIDLNGIVHTEFVLEGRSQFCTEV
jgi:hypothetical protein